jgi:hypothetical protein
MLMSRITDGGRARLTPMKLIVRCADRDALDVGEPWRRLDFICFSRSHSRIRPVRQAMRWRSGIRSDAVLQLGDGSVGLKSLAGVRASRGQIWFRPAWAGRSVPGSTGIGNQD